MNEDCKQRFTKEFLRLPKCKLGMQVRQLQKYCKTRYTFLIK